jgi:nucleoside-diphosphate-sugar epimerase
VDVSPPVTPASPPPVRYDAPVVVTGGAGLLGRDVVRQLVEGGCPDIRVIDLESSPTGGAGPARVHRLDLRHDDLSAAFAGARTVFHLAACQYHSALATTTYRLPFTAVNVEGTRRVLEAARRGGARTVVYVSTSMVYGLPQRVPMREDHPRVPLGPYGRSKLEAERLVEAAHASDLGTVIVRPPALYGPGRTGVITRLFDRILAGRVIPVIGRGHHRQELAAPEDCARLVLLAGERADEHAVYNCGAATVPTMREWIGTLIAEAGSASVIRAVPVGLAEAGLGLLERAHLAPLRREQYAIASRDYWLDTSAARARLGWVPRWGGLDAALALFRWYRATRGWASEA